MDGINDFVVDGDTSAVNPEGVGTKAAAHFRADVPGGGSARFRLRLTSAELSGPSTTPTPSCRGQHSANSFYADLQRDFSDADARLVQRQATAGMIWTKQWYHYGQERLHGDPGQPVPPPERKIGRKQHRRHLYFEDILSMPDSGEDPWFAVWDSAFHALPFAHLDPDFAKRHLTRFTREW